MGIWDVFMLRPPGKMYLGFGQIWRVVLQARVAVWSHDDVIKWKHLPRYWPFVWEFTGPGEFPAQRPVTRSFDGFFTCAWITDWVNYREAGDLRRYRAHYDVTVMRAVSRRQSGAHKILVTGWHVCKHVYEIHKKHSHVPFDFLSWRHYLYVLFLHYEVVLSLFCVILPVTVPVREWAQHFHQLWQPEISKLFF